MTALWTRAGRGSGATSMVSRGVVGFISATDTLFDPGSIGGLKAAIDAAAVTAGASLDIYLVEMSPRRAGETWTPAVRDLLLLARAGRLRGVVVGHVDDFAADRDDALLVAVTLAGWGVRIVEAGRPVSVAGPCVAKRPVRRRASRDLAGHAP